MAELFEVESDGSVVVSVMVQPGAARAGIVGRYGDALKLRVSAPAEAGRANAAVVDLVAASLGVRRRDVEVVTGATGRRKRLRLRGVEADAVRNWLTRVASA